MDIQTLRTMVLSVITLICMDEVSRQLVDMNNRLLALGFGVIAILVYLYCGRQARLAGKRYGWLLIPPVIFAIVPVVLRLMETSLESGISWWGWGRLLPNLQNILGFVTPILLLIWIYYALNKHLKLQSAT